MVYKQVNEQLTLGSSLHSLSCGCPCRRILGSYNSRIYLCSWNELQAPLKSFKDVCSLLMARNIPVLLKDEFAAGFPDVYIKL